MTGEVGQDWELLQNDLRGRARHYFLSFHPQAAMFHPRALYIFTCACTLQ